MVNRRSLIKHLACVMTGLIALLATYIVIGSIDSEEPKYHDFVGELAPANPELNGYTYLDARGFVGEEIMDDEQGKWLKRDLKYGGWEANAAAKLVNQYREEIDAFKVAAAMPILQYEQTDDPTELPLYVDLLNGIRLILLEAKLSAAQGRMEESVKNLKLAWQFSEKV